MAKPTRRLQRAVEEVKVNEGDYPWWICPNCGTKNVIVRNPKQIDECLGCETKYRLKFPEEE